VQKPVNVVISATDPEITAQQLADVGVKRISVGGALSRLAFAAVRDAAVAMRDAGTFRWVRDTFPSKDLRAIFQQSKAQ
jgi:2-methylisocitrate lyase-like PEP mutase family enzyme